MNLLGINSTIKGKLTAMLLLFVFMLTILFAWQLYQTQRRSILDGIDRQLFNAAVSIPFVLPDGFHDMWSDSTHMPDSLYIPLSKQLQRYADSAGVNYLYSFVERGDRIFFFISSNTDSQFVNQSYVGFGRPYDDASANLLACFKSGGVVQESAADEYGTWRSALVRKQTARGKSYVLGADISIRHIDNILRSTLIRSAQIGLLGFMVFLLITLRVADSITVPLRRLEQQTHQIVQERFDVDKYDTSVLESIGTRFKDEAGRLASAFLHMFRDLAEHIRKLEHETTLRNRIESEMNLAGEVQRSYLPGVLADPALLTQVDLFGTSKPARSAGGDLYDYTALEGNRLLFAVGDVSDKGMAAALFMAITVTLLRDASLRGFAPAAIADAVNSSLARHNDLCQFVTLFFGILDLDTGDVAFVNAGHNPPYIRRANGTLERLAQRHGPAMGVMPDSTYGQGTFHLERGELLLMYTDGVTEAFNRDGKLYSEPRLRDFIDTVGDQPTARIAAALLEHVVRFADGAPQSDDITILALQRRTA